MKIKMQITIDIESFISISVEVSDRNMYIYRRDTDIHLINLTDDHKGKKCVDN